MAIVDMIFGKAVAKILCAIVSGAVVRSRVSTRNEWPKRVYPWLVLAGVLLINGCTTLLPQSHSTARGINTVAVISLLGPNLHSYLVEPTLFTSFTKIYPFPQWKMEGYAEGVVRDALNPRLRVVSLQYDADKLQDGFTNGGKRSDLVKLAPLLHTLVNQMPVDAVVVVSPANKPDPIYDLPVWLIGYGMYRRITTGMSDFEANMYVSVELTVFDGQTLKISRSASGFEFRKEFDPAWYSEPDRLTPEFQEKLRNGIEAMLREELTGLVNDLGLGRQGIGLGKSR